MAERWVPTKPNFGPPPAGYVAGLGRGATGFVTRSDLGPAARANNMVQLKAAQNDQAVYADNKYDSWQGYKGALFTKEQVDQQDKQADDAFDFCQRRMEQRRLKQKQNKIKQQLQKQQKLKKNPNNMPISQQFTDLKRQLAKVTEQEWMNLPQSVDLSIKKRKRQKYTPVPDSMIMSYLNSNVNKTQVQTIGESNQNFRQAKQMLLKSNLQKAQNQTEAKPVIDRVGYLTHLDTSKIDQQMLGDIKRARVLHKAALASNPKNPDIWLSAARIQELDGKLQDCRNILHKALEHCPLNQDIWIQLSRVERAEQSKNILIQSLRNLPKSEKIWLTIARKQQGNKQMKSKILRKGLQNIPQSTKLWKQLIQLSNMQQAKNLLYKAVQCLPKQIDLWIGLAKLQTYENAKQILNKARKANPLNLAIWISAAKLQQTQSDNHEKTVNKIQTIVTKGRQILKKNGNSISRQQMLQQALICQRSNNLRTCQSIVKSVISLGLTIDQLNHSLFKDVDLFEKQFQSIHTTRFIYKYGIIQTQNPKLLEKLLEFQQRLAIQDLRSLQIKKSQIMESLKFGLKIFPKNLEFWLTMIDRLIDYKNYQQANHIIEGGIQNLSKEQLQKLYLKRVQIYKRQNRIDQARNLLSQLRSMYVDSLLSAIQTIWFEYHLQNYEVAWKFCSQLFRKNIKNQEVWTLALKIKRKIGTYDECKNIADKAVSQHPKSIQLWKNYTQLQLQYKFEGKARTVIDKALMKNPKNQQLYLLLIQLQISCGNTKQITTTLAKAVKDSPKSGQIWAIAIILQPHNTRKKKASIAIQHCGTDPSINLSVAKLFWKDNKIDKARKWLQDAIHSDKTNGDIWAYYYKLICEQFPQQAQKVLTQFIQIGKITHGRKWLKIKQDSIDGWKLNEKQILQKLVKQIGDQIYKIQ